MSCDVCCGEGRYPIHNRFGSEVYSIECPECCGSGQMEAEAIAAVQANADRQRYEAAMAETRDAKAKGATP